MGRILVVDDAKEIRSLVNQILSQSGHEIVLASDAMEAMELLNSFWVDLLILDIEMPYTNGLQFSQTLRASKRFHFLPIVFLTARREKKDVDRALEIQAENYLLKPINKEKLLSVVNGLFEKTKPKIHESVSISNSTLAIRADVIRRDAIQLVSVSEAGFLVQSSFSYAPEDIVQLDTSFFKQADIPNLPLKVGAQKNISEGVWEVSLLFCNLNLEISNKIKMWILSQISKAS